MRRLVFPIVVLIGISMAASLTAFAADDYVCSPEMVPPDRVRMHVYGDTTSQYLPGICRGIAEFAIVFPGADDMPAVDFYVYTSRDDAIDKTAAITGTSRSTASQRWNPDELVIHGQAYRTSVVVHVSQKTSFGSLVGLAAHELTHVVQDAHRVPIDPSWLREGAAEYVKFMALDSSHFESLASILKLWKDFAPKWENVPAPRDMVRSSSFLNAGRYAYISAFLAFDFLIAEVGFENYATCYLQESGGFEDCFQLTIDEFYDRYSEYSEAGFVLPPRPQQRLHWCLDSARVSYGGTTCVL